MVSSRQLLRGVFVMLSCAALGACTSTKSKPVQTVPSNADNALAEAAVSVRQSLTNLGAVEQAAYPPQSVAEPPLPETYGMDVSTSIDWDGPVEPLVKQIANAANYRLRVLGKRPSIPVMISISAQDELLGNILRDVGYQSRNRAQVVVFPSTRVIELRYIEL